jgi:TolB-like protein
MKFSGSPAMASDSQYEFGSYRLDVQSGMLFREALLVVLPFENLTIGERYDYFSDGLTEEMITELARLSPEP